MRPERGTILSLRLFAEANNCRATTKMRWTAVRGKVYGYCTNELNAKHFA